MCESILDSKIDTSLIDIRNQHRLGPLRLSRSRRQQAHGTRSENQNRLSLLHQTPSIRMNRHAQRLEQGTKLIAHIRRQLMTPLSRMINRSLQRPLEMRETLRRAPEAHFLADVVAALVAAVA